MSDKAQYHQVENLRPGRSAFDLSHAKLFDANIGALIPVLCEDVLPGDIFQLGNLNLIRSQPLVCPVFHKLDAYCHYFFVPYRLMYPDWQKFITGGVNGDDATVLPKMYSGLTIDSSNALQLCRMSLWDYFGFPIHDPATGIPSQVWETTSKPQISAAPWLAYWMVWRDYYRDENFQLTYPDGSYGIPVSIGQDQTEMQENLIEYVTATGFYEDNDVIAPADNVAFRCWTKDYFTSCLPWQQRGIAPAIPISGTGNALWNELDIFATTLGGGTPLSVIDDGTLIPNAKLLYTGTQDPTHQNNRNFTTALNENVVNLTAAGVTVSDLRLTVQTQKWMERNARGGYRMNEFLKAHFGVSPQDMRLDRPEYIGGSHQNVIISEILQNSSTDATSPQGNMAGHGISVSDNFCGKYRAEEHGVIIGIMSIMPEAIYQSGVPRMWTRETRFDYYTPEFAHLSEMEVKRGEIMYRNNSTDYGRFGFQGIWDEYRNRQSIVCGNLANTLNVWTLSRIMAPDVALNEMFLTTEYFSKNRRDAWAVSEVQNQSQGQFFVQWRNLVKAIRPLPWIAEPGMLDHF